MPKIRVKNRTEATTVAQDVMSSDLVVLRKNQTFRDAIELLTERRLTVLPVVNSRGKLIGLLTEKEVLGACKSLKSEVPNFLDRPIRFKKDVYTADLMTPMEKIKAILAHKPFRHLPIVDNKGVLRGIITRRDLIRVMYLRIELKAKSRNREI
jgi:CBS domain-containing protein